MGIPRDEMMARMPSLELTRWQALFQVKADERQYERDLRDSGDGQVHVYGKDTDDDEEESEDIWGDGETE